MGKPSQGRLLFPAQEVRRVRETWHLHNGFYGDFGESFPQGDTDRNGAPIPLQPWTNYTGDGCPQEAKASVMILVKQRFVPFLQIRPWVEARAKQSAICGSSPPYGQA